MIILQFDNAYHRWGLLALQSLQLHEPGTKTLCDTVNLSAAQVGELEQAHGNVTVLNDTTTWPTTTPAAMAARKPFVMQNIMDRFPDEPWYGLFDADFLVRRPLNDLWTRLNGCPIALFRTNGMWMGKYYRRILTPSGIVLVRSDGRLLIDCWVKWQSHQQPLESIEPGAWFWDQITLVEAYEETRLPCATIPMNIFGDNELWPSSAIWSAHVPQKDRYYQLFLNEYLRQVAEGAK